MVANGKIKLLFDIACSYPYDFAVNPQDCDFSLTNVWHPQHTKTKRLMKKVNVLSNATIQSLRVQPFV